MEEIEEELDALLQEEVTSQIRNLFFLDSKIPLACTGT
jgi:hypothetical protein